MRFNIDGCVGCGFCYLIWPGWFRHKTDDGGKAEPRDIEISETELEDAEKAVKQCPGQAITIKGAGDR